MVYRTISDYCNILGVSSGASVEELKKAYRVKAKQLHPDRNKKPTAHEDFILLTEAYEYLLKNGTTEYTTSTTYNSTWYEAEREEVRQRAARYGDMNYDEFENTDYYQGLTSLKTVGDHLYFFWTVFAFSGILAGIISLICSFSFTGGLVLFLVILPLSYFLLRKLVDIELDRKAFFSALAYIFHSKAVVVVFITAFNLFVFWKIGMQTLVTPVVLVCFYVLPMLLSFLAAKVFKPSKRKLYALCIAPLIVSVLLDVNFLFSSGAERETYSFSNGLKAGKHGYQETTFITLDGNKYEQYPGIRIFMDYEDMRGRSAITYTFKRGLFGLRVMRHYEFSVADGPL